MKLSQPDAGRAGEAGEAQGAPIEPLDPRITSIQPGGGACMRLELLWGSLRRAYLKAFRSAYLRRMAALRQGNPEGCPHEVLDPRDLKFYRNVCECRWDEEHDPFAWRDRLPFAREGLCELIVMGGSCLALAIGLAFVYWPLAMVPAAAALFLLWFFRHPRRRVDQDAGIVVSPADGKVVSIDDSDGDDFVTGPAITIGIFLSVFNVHVNRAPVAARVIGLSYRPGKFLNALRAVSARENEQLAIRLEQFGVPRRRFVVRQIAGAIARRIVCRLKPGEVVACGEHFGMIKLGSRTELVLPREPGLQIAVRVGQSVRGGSSILARYPTQTS
jgi:phosphatidylserine decarboxylase